MLLDLALDKELEVDPARDKDLGPGATGGPAAEELQPDAAGDVAEDAQLDLAEDVDQKVVAAVGRVASWRNK